MHHNHPKSIVNTRIHSVVFILSLDKCMKCSHHQGIIWCIFTALKSSLTYFQFASQLIGQKICRLWDHPMSSNIISRNHVKRLLQNYKKQVGRCESTAPLNVFWILLARFSIPIWAAIVVLTTFKKKFVLVLESQLIPEMVSFLASEFQD